VPDLLLLVHDHVFLQAFTMLFVASQFGEADKMKDQVEQFKEDQKVIKWDG